MPSCPTDIGPQEPLGRAVFDTKKADDAKKGKVHPKIFQEQLGVRELSVDRLAYVDLKIAAALQTDLRGRQCRGWAVVQAATASKNGRTVVADPMLPLQPHHAHILLPSFAEDQAFYVQKQHALELAMIASWREAV